MTRRLRTCLGCAFAVFLGSEDLSGKELSTGGANVVVLERASAAGAAGAQSGGTVTMISASSQASAAGPTTRAANGTIALDNGFWPSPSSAPLVAALGVAGLALLAAAGMTLVGRRRRRGELKAGHRVARRHGESRRATCRTAPSQGLFIGADPSAKPMVLPLAIAIVTFAIPSASHAVPEWMSHQGRVLVDGAGPTGNGYFKFALLSGTSTTLWTNDGTIPEAATAVTLPLADGYFFASLGQPPMVPLPATTLVGQELRLRVWFAATQADADAGIFNVLSPDLQYGAMPAAFEALSAADAQTLGGKDPSEFAASAHQHAASEITSGVLGDSRIPAAITRDTEVMPAVLSADGAGSGLDADLLDGREARNQSGQIPINNGLLNPTLNADLVDGLDTGNASGQIPISNGSVNADLNADLLDGFTTGNGTGGIPINNGTVNTDLNADLLDGFTTGNETGRIPLNNGTVNTDLNADLLDGKSAAEFFALGDSATLTGRPAFNGGTSGTDSPFTVDSTTTVDNLSADLLDGLTGSQLLRSDVSGTLAGTLTVNSGTGADTLYTEAGAERTRTGLTTLTFFNDGRNAEDTMQIQVESDSAASAPAYSFVGDADTGMFLSAENALAFAAGGTQVVTVSSSGLSSTTTTLGGAGITGTGPAVAAGHGVIGTTGSGGNGVRAINNSSVSAALLASNASGDYLRASPSVSPSADPKFRISNSGAILADGPLSVGHDMVGSTSIAFNSFGDSDEKDEAAVSGATDVFIEGTLEVDGTIYAGGASLIGGNLQMRNTGTDGTQSIFFRDNGSPTEEWLRWHGGHDRFELSSSLTTYEALYVGLVPITQQAYSSFGTGNKDESAVADIGDVYISDDLEVDGSMFVGGGSLGLGDSAGIGFTNNGTVVISRDPLDQSSTASFAIYSGGDPQFRIEDGDEANILGDGTFITNGLDYAEAFKVTDQSLEAGDVVALDLGRPEHIERSSREYDSVLVGVLSARPGFLTGNSFDAEEQADPGIAELRRQAVARNDDKAEAAYTTELRQKANQQNRAVALAGRVPVKVDGAFGPIRPGDRLTSSPTAGHAMTMTEAGPSIGVAMEGWNDKGRGQILVLIQPSWWDPRAVQARLP